MIPPFSKSRDRIARRGFALVISLALMVLITVIAVGMLGLSTISLRTSSQSSDLGIARANARLALALALGELQVHMGPDTRISARAETLAKDPRVNATVAANSPQAWWVGVTDSDRTKSLGSESVVWLVSGLSGNSPEEKISGALADPVTMVGEGSLDLSVTGGLPLQAGREVVRDSAGKPTGACAWMIDDNGMKAQLTASRPVVSNTSKEGPLAGPFGSGVIPGTYQVGILDGMSSMAETPSEEMLKLVSTNNLPLVNLPADVTRSKYFSYTTSSLGVLSDVKKGGLKKDLTVAFENPAVFNNVFPASKPDQFIIVDPNKRPAELTKGYIHWGIFRDYYNLKKHLATAGGVPSLAPTLFEKSGFVANLATDPFRAGQLGPHAMAAGAPSSLPGYPYGAIAPAATGAGNPAGYPFNPISTVLGSIQETAWVSQAPAQGNAAPKVRTHVQLFTSHYNPYNIALNMTANTGAGPRVQNYPQVLFTVGGTTLNQVEGLSNKLQTHVPAAVILEPGRSHVLGFGNAVASGSEIDGAQYSESVGKIVTQSVYKDHASSLPADAPVKVDFEFVLASPSLLHGLEDHPGDKEIAQVFFTPFAWDQIATKGGMRSGKRITKTATASQLENAKATFGLWLRTTREPGGSIRPLVDANVRAIWNNPRWDSSLDLPVLAAYSSEGSGEIFNQPIPQMEIGSKNRGFSYWGNSRGPSSGNDRVILFDIPRRDLVSIGQLQHANAGRFSYEPTYIAGNSYANPRIPLGVWKESVADTFSAAKGLPPISGNFTLYDASYLVNDVIFDSHVFTTIPQVRDDFAGGALTVSAATYSGLLEGSLQLPNPRYLPYCPKGSEFTQSRLKDMGNATRGSYFHNAGHVVADGLFNVNSTSVDAWEAFLSGTHGLPVQKLAQSGAVSGFHPAAGVRFPRAASHLDDGMTTASIDSSYWTGFRELTQSEVREIAVELVEQVKQRGPFLSMGEFVNRKLEDSELGKSGALQSALDATVNKGLDSIYESPVKGGSFNSRIPAGATQGAGFPGQLLQGDVLQALAPCMSVRSDTFTIRSYGEARDSNNVVTARAWCESTVQRFPEPMAAAGKAPGSLDELALPSSLFGRRFEVISFRWLHPDEV